ncbi:hypothetical protein SAMN05216559_0872 [Halomicrobium zhouii]|uniref:Spondin_N n=1 Tax=Halomicrobium zhouii TaxID=767519 RepID=A0A1I6KIJ2_9EURY|nr:hypothetical protein [Halomicrobium zhouii]SFR91053.1 hypothetical protein SAMN05216559_0872 [Halomicrobium zhouii]
MRRRALLSALGVGGSALLSGCGSRDRENEVELTVRNDSQQKITLDVFVTTDEYETVFSAHYTLAAEKADESKSFYGTASRVYAIVNESETKVKTFDPQPCSGTNTIPVGVSHSVDGEIHIGVACSDQ